MFFPGAGLVSVSTPSQPVHWTGVVNFSCGVGADD